MKKKILAVLMVGIIGMSLVACGKENTTDAPVAGSEHESVQDTQKEEPQQEETQKAEQPKDEAAEKEDTKEYVDNFAVDSEAAAAFAKKIKEAVANQDLEALADLASYPLYVGFTDGSAFTKASEELVDLGAEKIFTSEMMESIKNADENSLSPSMAGFALYSDGGPGMVFGVVDGKLAIQGINY